MARVYVSSTVADLTQERQAVTDWLVAAQHQVVHSYRPNSDTVRDSCLADVDTCDLYVLILGHRYGFQLPKDNPEGLSITQLEFRRAGQSGKPRVALLRTSIPDVSLADIADPQKWTRVQAFRDEVAGAVRAAEFSDLRGLIQELSTGSRPSWRSNPRLRPGRAACCGWRRGRRFWPTGRTCSPNWMPGWPAMMAGSRGSWRCTGWPVPGRPRWRWPTPTVTSRRSTSRGSSLPRTPPCWPPGSVSWPPR
jgi:Domain of unknown function (DUF4062)